ncbi:hypothetical protein NM688_g4776 [Phlebia brevispora]|uniref:Uncharacterized protein n=1 Tax=Phlebia brevispora TaxID=194682 RepID=A0ACC1T1Z8_9APHY|nr:hypothetical protein NM688_g4776 [Phlebia brevispora]
MSLSRFFYEPFYSMSDFDRLFDEAFNARTEGTNAGTVTRASTNAPRGIMRPRMDLYEDDKTNKVVATFELPGMKKEDINIDVQNNCLTVSGEAKVSSDREESGWQVQERRYGKFSRCIAMPQGVKEKDIHAHMDNGILSVTFPKSTPEETTKKIAIH